MKIAGATTFLSPAGKDANSSTHTRTNFQQLVAQLEQDMWSGAKAGPNGVQTLPRPNKASIQQSRTQQQLSPGPAQDSPFPTVAPSMKAEAAPSIRPVPPSPVVQVSTSAVLPIQTKQNNTELGVSTPQAFFILPTRAASNAVKANAIEQSHVARTPPPTAPTANEGDRLSLLPGTTMPTVVVRYTGSSADLPQLKRALQDVLRRHGINDTSLTINGFDALARIEHGANHGR